MDKRIMLKAFEALDKKLGEPLLMLIGGGAAMLLAHGVPLSTMDIDGVLVGTNLMPATLDPLIKKVARELSINPHWFNSYFSTFTYTIPSDYKSRLIAVFKGKFLEVSAFGAEDLLIMKCFSGREKDVGHARALAKKADMRIVENHIQKLIDKGVPDSDKAMDFLDAVRERINV